MPAQDSSQDAQVGAEAALKPTIASVDYVDPWAAPPLAFTAPTLRVSVTGATSGTQWLWARMLLNGEPWGDSVPGTRSDAIAFYPPGPLFPGNAYGVQVQWIATNQPVAWTDPQRIATAPVLATTLQVVWGAFDGSKLLLTWEGGGGPAVPPGAAISVWDAQGVVRGAVTRAGGSAVVTVTPVDSTYAVYVRGAQPTAPGSHVTFTAPLALGPFSPPLPMPATGPVVSSVAYDGSTLTVQWAPVAEPPSIAAADVSYALHLLSGGKVVATFPAGSAGGRATVGPNLASAALHVAGRARFGPISGPLSAAPVAVLSPGPAIVRTMVVRGTGTSATVTAELASLGSAHAAVDLLVDGVVAKSVAVSGASPKATFKLRIATGAHVQATARRTASGAVTSSGSPGRPATVLTDAPEVASASYDGSVLSVRLKRPASADVRGYAAVLTPSAGTPVSVPMDTGLRTATVLDLGLTWRLTLTPLGDGATGPASTAVAVKQPAVAAPAVRSVAYDGAMLAIEWSRAALPGLSGYTVTLAGGVSSSYATGPRGGLSVPLAISAALAGTTVKVAGNSPDRSTAASAAVSVPVPAPLTRVAGVSFDGASIVVRFDSIPAAAVTAAVFKGAPSGKGDGVVAPSAPSTSMSATIAASSAKFAAGSTYVVALTHDATVAAPVWGAPTPLIVMPPTIESVVCDGERATIAVAEAGSPATGTIIRLLRGGATVAAVTAGPAGGSVPIGREPAATATTATVAATGGDVTGPPGSAAPVLLDTPRLSAVTLAGDAIKGTAGVVGSPPIGTPRIHVAAYGDGVLVGTPISVAAGPFSIPVTAPMPREWTLRAWLSGTKGGVACEGPPGLSHPVLVRPPRLLDVVLQDATGNGYDWHLAAAWDVGAFADGCDVTLVQGTRTLLSVSRAQSPINEKIVATPPVARSSVPLTVTVTPHGTTGFAATATLLAALVEVKAVCDGGVVRASWSVPPVDGHPPPSAYRLRLVRAQDSGWETIASTSGYAAAGELALADSGEPSHGVAVDVGIGDAWSSAGKVTPLVVRAPGLTSATWTLAQDGKATCAVAWAWQGGAPTSPAITGYAIVVVQDGSETVLGTAAASATSASVGVPASTPPSARLGVRAISGQARGPLGTTTPVLMHAPAVTRVTAVPEGLRVDFDATVDPALAYTATLRAGETDAAHDTVAASPATIALDSPAKATKYEISVAAASNDGVGVGPASPRVGALLVAPSLTAASATDAGVRVTVVAPDAGGIQTTSYDAEILYDGVVVASAPGLVPSGGVVSVAPPASVDPRGTYSVRLQPVGAGARGPAAALQVLLAAPVIASAVTETVDAKLVATVAVDASGLAADGMAIDVIARTDKGDSAVIVAKKGVATVPIPAGATTCALHARVRGGHARGPWSPPLAAPIARPAVAKVAWDGRAVTLLWGAVTVPDTVDRYRVEVGAAGVPVAGATVHGTAATLPVALPGSSPAVVVRALAGPASGPPSDPVGVPLAAPAIAKVVTDPATGLATVSWTAPAGAAPTGYRVQAYLDDRPAADPVTTTATSLQLASAATVGADMQVAVAASWKAGAIELEGAYGRRRRVPTGLAILRDVDTDGTTALARWDPVHGATGYALQVTAAGLAAPVGHAQVGAAERFARFAVDLSDTSRTYSMVIQAMIGDSTGPPSSGPLFQPGLYLTETSMSHVLARASKLPLAAQPVTAYLPAIGTIAGLPIAPAQAGATGAPFTLAANTDASSKSAFPYTLTIAHGALAFDAARQKLAGTYSALLSAAEDGGATPAGIFAIQQAIARLMPQTLPETLFYAYGLTTDGSVDLRPGCVLRVAFSHWDQTGAPKSDWSTGYAGGPVVDYDIVDYVDDHGSWLVGFDAFVSWLAGNSVLTVPAPQLPATATAVAGGAGISESGAAEAADLLFADFRRPFCRLFFPDALQAANAPATGRTGQQFAIAAAAKWKLIDASSRTPVAGTSVAYFRGRAVVKLCVRVTVDGAERVVPVGTTVGNLLEQAAARAPSAPIALRGLAVERATGPAVLDPTAPYAAGRRERVRLDWKGLVTWTGGDALSLPVLHGDRITLAAP